MLLSSWSLFSFFLGGGGVSKHTIRNTLAAGVFNDHFLSLEKEKDI